MRSYPGCWNKTLSRLGFRRKRRKASKQHDYLRRRSLFEVLEARQMLSADPLFDLSSDEIVVAAAIDAEPRVLIANEPEFFLIQPEIPKEELVGLSAEELAAIEPVFQVETVATLAGPKAKLSFNPAFTATPPSSLQELRLELRQDGRVLEAFDVLIDIAEEDFREQFLNDRIEAIATEIPEINRFPERPVPPNEEVAAAVEYVRNLYGPLTMEQSELYDIYVAPEKEFKLKTPADTTSEDLPSWSKRQAERRDVLTDDAEREEFYTLVYGETQETKQERLQASTEAEQQAVAEREKSLQNMTLLLARDLEQDMQSKNLVLAQTATQLRDELVAVSNPRDILFAGLQVDQEIERKIFADGQEKAVSFVESGQYVFSDNLEIDLGKHQAMVQVTKASKLRTALATSVSESPAVEDGSTDEANPSANGGLATTLQIDGSTGALKESLIRFNLEEVTSFDNPTAIASAILELSEIGTGAGNAEVYVWNGLLEGPTGSVSDWDETNVSWNHADTTLDLKSKLSEFTKLSDWAAGVSTDIDLTPQVARALLYGDANGDGEFDGSGAAGDIEAFHLAVTNWDAYVAEYGPRANAATDLLSRVDGGLGNGTVDTADIEDFFRRVGYSRGDYNLDGTVQDNEDSGIDGLDWAVFNANYGVKNARFSQGDGNFDGEVGLGDYDVWFNHKGEDNVTAEQPELVLWIRPEDTATEITFAAQEHATLDGPTLVVEEQPDLALNKFSVQGNDLVVDYAAFGEDFTNVKVQLYKAGDPDTLLHETGVLTGTLGSHQTLIATSVLASIVEGDSIYAKVIGTPAAGTQFNTDNDQLDFEFSTDAIQTVNSADDSGMDTLLRGKHTLRELIVANETLGWFDTLSFNDPTVFVGGSQTITLGDHDGNSAPDRLDIDHDLTIEGPGVDLLTIDARGETQGINVAVGAEVHLSGFAIVDGYSTGHGGGIYNRGQLTLDSVAVRDSEAVLHGGGILNYSTGTLELISSTVDGNVAGTGGGISGLVITSGEALTITSSTISNNTSSGSSGGLAISGTSGGAASEVLITNSTFSGNDAASSAGAIRSQTNIELTIVNSTIHDNSAASQAGGIYPHTGTTTLLHNTIIAGNHTNSYATWSDALAVTAYDSNSSNNLIGIRHYSIGISDGVNGNQMGTSASPIDPLLAELDDYGGPTRTHGLLTGSLAIDAGNDAIAATYGTTVDQTGVSQQYDTESVGVAGVMAEVGAFSHEEVALVVNDVTDDFDGNPDVGPMTLRDATELARRPGDSTITFDASMFSSPQTISLKNFNSLLEGLTPRGLVVDFASATAASHDLTFVGPGADLLTIDAQGAENVFYKRGAINISGVSITGASSTGIRSTGDLTLDGVEIRDNQGMGVTGGGVTTITNSTVAENLGVGIKMAGLGSHTISNTTISGNRGTGLYAKVGDTTLTNVTITDNVSTEQAGGIFVSIGPATPPATVTLNNTIVADNFMGGTQYELQEDTYGDLLANLSHNNLVGDAASAAGLSTSQNNVVGTAGEGTIDPGLSPLGNYGGTTSTHVPLPHSPVIDAGDRTYATALDLTTDQRGDIFGRVFAADQLGLDDQAIDIGAIEWQGLGLHEVNTLADSDTDAPGKLGLRQAIARALPGQTITFSRDLDGKLIELGPESDLLITKALTIDASDLPNGITLKAYDPTPAELLDDGTYGLKGDGGRLFYIEGDSNTEVVLRGLKLTGGDTWDSGGAIRSLGASLTLEGVQVVHNAAPRPSGYEILGYEEEIETYEDRASYGIKLNPVCGNWQAGARAGGVFSTGNLMIRDSYFANNATSELDLTASNDDQTFCNQESDLPAGSAGVAHGEVYSGDIYSLGDLTIEGSLFESQPLDAADELGIPDQDSGASRSLHSNYAIGGIYATNFRYGESSNISIQDTDFVNTRGIVVDTAEPFDRWNHPTDFGQISNNQFYEVTNISGGTLRVHENNSFEDLVPVPTKSLFVFSADEFHRAEFMPTDVPEDLPAPPTQFDLRRIQEDGSTTDWVQVNVVKDILNTASNPVPHNKAPRIFAPLSQGVLQDSSLTFGTINGNSIRVADTVLVHRELEFPV